MRESFNEMDSNLEGDVGHRAGSVRDFRCTYIFLVLFFFFFTSVFLFLFSLPVFLVTRAPEFYRCLRSVCRKFSSRITLRALRSIFFYLFFKNMHFPSLSGKLLFPVSVRVLLFLAFLTGQDTR